MATWQKGTFTKWNPNQDKGKGQGNGQGQSNGQGQDDDQSQGDGLGGKSQDEIADDIEKKLGKRNEIGSDEEAKAEEEKQDKGKGRKGGQKGNPGTGAMGDLESRKAEIDAIVPRMNWKAMMKLMVSSSTESIEPSYSKPSRRGLTGISVAAQTGQGAMKPGDKLDENKQNKICLVIDTSGSMYGDVPTVLAEVKKLLKQLGKSAYPLGLVYFADRAIWFQINLGKDTAYQVQGAAEIIKPNKDAKELRGIENLISKASTGGTVFSGALMSNLSALAAQGYNIMIFSDTDMLIGNNFKNLMSLWTGHRNNLFVVWDSLESWRTACTQINQIPKTFTHLPPRQR